MAGWRNKPFGSSISSSSSCDSYLLTAGSHLSSSGSHLLTCGCGSHLLTAGWNFHWRTKYCSMSRLFNYRKGKQKKEKVTAGSSISHICWRLAAAHICWRPAEISIGEQNIVQWAGSSIIERESKRKSKGDGCSSISTLCGREVKRWETEIGEKNEGKSQRKKWLKLKEDSSEVRCTEQKMGFCTEASHGEKIEGKIRST